MVVVGEIVKLKPCTMQTHVCQLLCELLFCTLILSLKIGNWDGGTSLEKLVEAASELRVPGLLQVLICWDHLDD